MIADEEYLDDNVAQTIMKSIRNAMKCCCCGKTMELPIWTCLSGHNICSKCTKSNEVCPQCFGNTKERLRNFELEKIYNICIGKSPTFFEEE
ncbi:E3 ubiquitin-protein ligase siah-1-like [Coccinella septempunctata]|uniref:E3 ubiquitin-protein ligase siah-1-like n=1 Tax=Coccinella septempunctata TaxID=41139 RepID=UPI001D07AD2C|nr:E3 ubiquitin-protein ligase siah-1-like isoform X2 [Coccinella septempunctata]XP_044764336.1 E3 ubiquitin-protein ligase siah-1-like isoform X2 [Coccinella septempunctata]XP_044764337.1 E3 ubiquitin-protein ligase siah-1-like [Coccinella septempunctata]XP_044764338.1 E3 ubiquitin-protein ligase siah-1-like [Coccinella septempunctata]XP_044764339.1 E3 ubiquitin-protein ligase siah-1-like [Coccinella septempunctata]XP_044764340.1 E3 ubiquitin-protein ligase siah-1-like [Coccinella septempunct